MGDAILVFIDEAGDFRQVPSPDFVRKSPFFILAQARIPAQSWRLARVTVTRERNRLGLRPTEEIKWSHVSSVLYLRSQGKPVPAGKKFSHLARLSDDEIRRFVERVLALGSAMPGCKYVFTVYRNGPGSPNESSFHTMHLRNHMQRCQFDFQRTHDLGLLFMDEKGSGLDKVMRSAYDTIYENGDFVDEYTTLKDTVSVEISHHSAGILLADLAAGTFNSFLKGNPRGSDLFSRLVWPQVRKSFQGSPLGYGIIDVPSRAPFRNVVATRLREAGLFG